jgi:hypothetical protein
MQQRCNNSPCDDAEPPDIHPQPINGTGTAFMTRTAHRADGLMSSGLEKGKTCQHHWRWTTTGRSGHGPPPVGGVPFGWPQP